MLLNLEKIEKLIQKNGLRWLYETLITEHYSVATLNEQPVVYFMITNVEMTETLSEFITVFFFFFSIAIFSRFSRTCGL